MRLADAQPAYPQLLLDILPAFVEALPRAPHPDQPSPISVPNGRKYEIRMNSITLLRFEIQGMQELLTKFRLDHELSKEDYVKAYTATEDILISFEELVDNAILGDEHYSVCLSSFHLTICLIVILLAFKS